MHRNRELIPPRLAQRGLLWLLRNELAEEVMGDLDEKFYREAEKGSFYKAKLNYWYQVIHYVRPFAIKKYRSNLTQHTMFKNYLKIGYRNLFKNKFTSFINIGGLAIGMAVAMLIGLWVYDELSYNKHHANYDRIAQVMFHTDWGSTEMGTSTVVTTGLGTMLESSYATYFEKVALVRSRRVERTLGFEKNSFIEDGYFMQPDGPEMFSLTMRAGTLGGLAGLRSIFLSESLARKIFGNTDPINQVIKFNESVDLTVTGVYEDLPRNSRFHDAAFFAPVDLYLDGWSHLNVWDNYNMYLYVQLRDGVNTNEASASIKDVMRPFIDESNHHELFLHPMDQWHLYSKFEEGKMVTSERLLLVVLYSVIGFFVLLLACVNFMNLSTARSENRAKEIGVRKSMGSARAQLLAQFLSESLLVSLLSFVVASIIVAVTLPGFNDLSGKNIGVPWQEPLSWVLGLGFVLITGVLAGSYPALYLSSFNPARSLKGTMRSGKYASVPRKVLVIFQFTISITLVIGTVIIHDQIQFVKDRPVGYIRDGLIMLPKRSPALNDKHEVLRQQLIKTGVVEEIALANYPLTNTLGNNNGFNWEGKDPTFNPAFNTIYVNHEYGKTIGWELLQGRDFSRDIASDAAGAVITESARQRLGIENPIGMILNYDNHEKGIRDITILGVVNDLIKGDPFKASQPGIMFLSEKDMSWMFIRIKENYPQGEAMAKIDEIFKELVPGAYADFKILEEEYQAKFQSEEQVGRLASLFALLAVVVSCLGLFGLAMFLAEKRSKEIGIRKVLGATVRSLWLLMTRDFVRLVMISSILAIPIAYYVLDSWVSQYDYHTDISWWAFVWTCLGALLVAMSTVSYQAIKSAMANPVTTLRSE